ncbi:interleukin-7 isoform X4 [Mastomys coucha]|uniref:interleukin-7 isoform X4 n=1 Tax=Mastomys coucha TaxID=35658 RepID=UPI001262AB29|nr:interleukin-7 isoform X4 [Mastomys coucha]
MSLEKTTYYYSDKRILDKMIGADSNCPNNEPNFFKKHLCDDRKEAAFLNRAARKLRQFLKMNISREFNVHLLKVSRGTQTLVNCTSKEEPLNYLCHMTQRDMTTALQYLLSILRTMLGTFKNSKLGRKKLKGTEKE